MPEAIFFSYMELIMSTDTTPELTPEQLADIERKFDPETAFRQTGKTLGFGIPLLTQVISPTNPEWAEFKNAGKPQGLVIVPTRELAIQVADDLETAGRNMGARVLSLYGGKAYEPQVEALKNEVAEMVVDGILRNQFWMMPDSERGDNSMRLRYESMKSRSNPTYLRQVPG